MRSSLTLPINERAQRVAQIRCGTGVRKNIDRELADFVRRFRENVGEPLNAAIEQRHHHFRAGLRRLHARGGAALADVERARADGADGDQLAWSEDESDGAGFERAVIAPAQQGGGEVERAIVFIEARGFFERGAFWRGQHVDAEMGFDGALFFIGRRFEVDPKRSWVVQADTLGAAAS
jgi:hypothetical protein